MRAQDKRQLQEQIDKMVRAELLNQRHNLDEGIFDNLRNSLSGAKAVGKKVVSGAKSAGQKAVGAAKDAYQKAGETYKQEKEKARQDDLVKKMEKIADKHIDLFREFGQTFGRDAGFYLARIINKKLK